MANVLVLGGTGFLGPEVVTGLLNQRHKVTLFNRGKTHAELFPDLEKLQGDRATGDLKALENRSWDAVIDVFASQPKWVKATAELLKERVKSYVFVSTISVYAERSQPWADESAPTYPEDEKLDAEDKVTNELYGPMKVRAEAIVRKLYPNTATIVRPGLIVGPTDPTDRFTYWPYRVNRGGEVLCPGDGTDPVQFIDVRDLGNFIAALVSDGHAGTYNATGPYGKGEELTFAEFLGACKAASTTPSRLTWVDADFLLQNGARPWTELPLWVPGEDSKGFSRTNTEKARAHGLTCRPVADTIRDTLAWNNTLPKDRGFRAGMPRTKAIAILEKWHARRGDTPLSPPTTRP